MVIDCEYNRGVGVVAPSGYIDEHTAPEVRRALQNMIEKQPHTIIMDFAHVEFMDSTGIGMLLGRYKQMQAKGIVLSVRNTNAQVDKLFRLTGIYSIISVVR